MSSCRATNAKAIEVDAQICRDGRVLRVECFGPGTYAANAGLTDGESAEVDLVVSEMARSVVDNKEPAQ